jgi:hypothetical protein
MTALYLNLTLMIVQESISLARGQRLTLPQRPVAMVVGTPSPSYWLIHSLADIDHLAHSPSGYFVFSQNT